MYGINGCISTVKAWDEMKKKKQGMESDEYSSRETMTERSIGIATSQQREREREGKRERFPLNVYYE